MKALWGQQLSLTLWRPLWRLVPDATPVPNVLRFDDPDSTWPCRPMSDHLQRESAALRQLVSLGCAKQLRGRFVPAAPVDFMLRTLVRPEVAVDLRLQNGQRETRALCAEGQGGLVVAVVSGHDARLELYERASPVQAVLKLVPPGTRGKLSLNVPSALLMRAVIEWENVGSREGPNAFMRALAGRVGPTDARDLFDVVRHEAGIGATFGVTVRFGPQTWRRADSVVVVRDSTMGRHVISALDDWTIVIGADEVRVERAISGLISSAGPRQPGTRPRR